VSQNIPLASGDIAVTPFFSATQEMQSGEAVNVTVLKRNATSVRILAGTGHDQVSLAIGATSSVSRFVTSDLVAEHPGGPAGTYGAWATTTPNSYTVGPPTNDLTDYRFSLVIAPESAPPAGLARRLANVGWDGAQITNVDNLVGPASGTSRHASTHGPAGSDPITPSAIGAAPAAAGTAIGGVLDWPWNPDPPGPAIRIPLDGRTIQKTTYPELFAVLGVTAATMVVQDRRGRTTLGQGTGTGLASRQVGDTGGEQTVQLTTDTMPYHAHSIYDPGHNHGVNDPGHRHWILDGAQGAAVFSVQNNPAAAQYGIGGLSGGTPNGVEARWAGVSGSATGIYLSASGTGIGIYASGNSQPHNNMPPFVVSRFFVRAR
jgi:microcystin-dependent protein